MNKNIIKEDLRNIARSPLSWESFEDKTILITAGNSMLGFYMALFFLHLREEKGICLNVEVLVRSKEKSETLYCDYLAKPYFSIICQDICSSINIEKADYIFHFAGNCSPYYICNDPVGIVKANTIGTLNVMELARRRKTERVVLASTREVYGASDKNMLREDDMGMLDPMDNRSCYPESKRAEETIAKSYFLQYGVPFCSVRLAHVYGPEMKVENDGRVMADFVGDAINGWDIVLKSDGKAERAFCYVSDAIAGMLYIVLKGKVGEAYNLSNESEPLPIREVAEMICEECEKDIKVVVESASQKGYCKYPRVALDNGKIQSLGFIPKISLREGIRRTIAYYNEKDI